MAELTTLARPYAKAAFERAEGADALADWSGMLALAAAIAGDEQVADRVIGNPLVEAESAAGFFMEVGGERFSDDFANLVRLLAENRRLALLPQIADLYERYRAEAEQTLEVELTTAIELPDDYRDRLEKALQQRFKRDINVTANVDASIIGGAVIRAGDNVVDGSVRGRLAKLANSIGR